MEITTSLARPRGLAALLTLPLAAPLAAMLAALLASSVAMPTPARASQVAAMAAAARVDPLWQRAREALAPMAARVADQVVTDIEMRDGSGKSTGAARIEERITGWRDGEPVREVVASNNVEFSDGIKNPIRVTVDNHPERALRADTVERLAPATCEGKPCALFAVSGAKGKGRYTGKVWVDEASGMPLKAVYELSGASMLKAMTQTIAFGRGGDGAWVPTRSVVDATFSVMFQTVRVTSQYQFKSWAPRP